MKPMFVKSCWLSATCMLALALTGCKTGWEDSGSADDPIPEDPSELATNFYGLGSYWRLELDEDNTQFTLLKSAKAGEANQLSASGSYQMHDSGFGVLTVNTVSAGNTVSTGDTLSFIRLKNFFVIVEPIEDNTRQVVPLINADHCASTDLKSNWILYKQANNFNADNDPAYYYGEITWTRAINSIVIERHLLDGTEAGDGLGSANVTCEDGIIVSEQNRYLVNNAKNAIIEIGEDASAIDAGNSDNSQLAFALERRSVNGVGTFDGTYHGYYSENNNNEFFPVNAECAQGACSLHRITDVTSGDRDEQSEYALNFASDTISNASDGFINATFTLPDEETTGPIICTVNTDYGGTGRYAIACVGRPPGIDDQSKFNNLFLITHND